MKKIVLLLLSALPFLSIPSHAQEIQDDSLRYSVSGKVTDSRNGSAIQFVNVYMEGRHHATVTNADGEFTLKSDIPIRRILFSHLGYESASVSPGTGPLRVKLIPMSTMLDPAIAISAEPWRLIREAVRRIPDNYVSENESLKCFYRETLQKRQRYVYISEAVATLYKTSYSHGNSRDGAQLEKSRVLLSQQKRDTLSVKFLGGPMQAIDFDLLKNTRLLLDESELELYNLSMGSPVSINDRLNLTVKLSPGKEVDYPLYYGTIYIDAATYAFTRIELSLDMSNEVKATRDMLVRKPAGLRFHPKELSVVVDYRMDGDKWRIGFLRSLLRFSCDWRKRLLSTNYTSVNELVVTDKYPEASPIPRERRFRSTDALSEKAELFTDPDFWKDYNIIEPSVSLEHAVGRLIKK